MSVGRASARREARDVGYRRLRTNLVSLSASDSPPFDTEDSSAPALAGTSRMKRDTYDGFENTYCSPSNILGVLGLYEVNNAL